ncbi:hypothetical protein DAEQUDRAFT_728083, partial [Daedalea quercina L-15889]
HIICNRFEYAARHPWWHGDLTPLKLAVPDVDSASTIIIYADDRCSRCVLTVHTDCSNLTSLHTYYDPIQVTVATSISDGGISRFVPHLSQRPFAATAYVSLTAVGLFPRMRLSPGKSRHRANYYISWEWDE